LRRIFYLGSDVPMLEEAHAAVILSNVDTKMGTESINT